MTGTTPNYNDGLWHGWNGGECPVHPLSEVEAVCTSIAPSGFGRASWKFAGEIDWAPGIPSNVIAFRVVNEHREPREFWIKFDMNGELPVVYGSFVLPEQPDGFVVHVREVLE